MSICQLFKKNNQIDVEDRTPESFKKNLNRLSRTLRGPVFLEKTLELLNYNNIS